MQNRSSADLNPKAIYVAGPQGGLYPVELGQQAVEPGVLLKKGGAAAKETVQTLNRHDCLVHFVRDRMTALREQSEEVCPACGVILEDLQALLDNLIAGSADATSLEKLRRLSEPYQYKSHCPAVREATVLILSALKHFPLEFRLHAENKFCPARACPRLLPAPCHQACPTNIDIPSFLALIAHGRHQEALEVIRQDNPFPWMCGLVCPRPCESSCIRANLDNPVNIRDLKAFVAEFASNHAEYVPLKASPANGHRVAIVGSGPAGLSAAHFLARQGYAVTIFEAMAVAGGTPGWGIPSYRLPREILQKEIDNIKGLGVEIKLNAPIGPGCTIDDLMTRHGFKAVFMAVGAQDSVRLPFPGTDAEGVYWGVEFLRDVSVNDKTPPITDKRVIVIGGGNVAIDVARVSLRVARISMERGATQVNMFCLEAPEEMPASQWEVDEAAEEGIEILHRWGVKQVITQDGKVTAIELKKVERVFDEQGRFAPTYFEDQTIVHEADVVIFAIGQKANLDFLTETDGIDRTPWGFIKVDPSTLATSRPGVFAGGDGATGPATVVKAVAAGKQAALSIHHFLSGQTGQVPITKPCKRRRVPFLPVLAIDKISTRRVPIPAVDPHERVMDFTQVELGYTEAQAMREAGRCLRCDVCIRCGTCAEVCREKMGVDALQFMDISETERTLQDYQRPQERCITCGACAVACPTNAMEYQEALDRREVRFCGTILNQLRTLKCQECGAPFVPPRYWNYITRRSDSNTGRMFLRRLCPKCSREQWAAKLINLW